MNEVAGFVYLKITTLFVNQARGMGYTLSTMTSVYTYNSDGALTSVATQVDQQAPTIQYLSWDNFIPDSEKPAFGTISPGNGAIIGYGASPVISDLDNRFQYDLQDRLIQYSGDQGTVEYQYYPTFMLATSTPDSGDTLHFYYHPGKNPQISNIEQAGSGVASGRLGPLRAFSDGGSQVLISPRKDVSGVYDPVLESFAPYHYNPFGAEDSPPTTSEYDIHKNPYQYAGEYKDSTWNGYYLRARWYKPEFHTFLSRDPENNLNRYAYTAGNPVSRVDPSGRNYKSYKKTMRPLSKWLHKTTGCKKCAAGRIFLGPITSPLSLIADPAGFYHTELASNGGFGLQVMMGTIALEVLTDAVIPEENYLVSYGVRLLGDAVSGAANSAAAATSHNFHSFNKRTFFQGLEFTAGGIITARIQLARGYRPFNKTLDDIEKMRTSLLATVNDDEVLVFKLKANLNPRHWYTRVQSIGPVGDMLDLGLYHEVLVGVTRDKVFFNEFGSGGARYFSKGISENGLSSANGFGEVLNKQWDPKKFQFVGKTDRVEFVQASRANPLGVSGRGIISAKTPNSYNVFYRNCQHYATAITNNLNYID